MGSLTDYAELEVLDHILKTGAYTPQTPYLALFTDDPTDTGSLVNEATYGGYARKTISFGAASGRSIAQDAQVDFDQCTSGSETISHWGIADAASGGNLIAYGAFNTGKSVQTGYTPFVESAEVTVTFSAGGVYTSFATTILDWLFDGGTLNQPTNIYIALHSTACADGAPGTELTGNNYGRIQCNTWDLAAAGASENTNQVTSAQASGDWSTAVYASLYDAVSGGNEMFYMDCNDLQVLSGEYARFAAGAYDITLD